MEVSARLKLRTRLWGKSVPSREQAWPHRLISLGGTEIRLQGRGGTTQVRTKLEHNRNLSNSSNVQSQRYDLLRVLGIAVSCLGQISGNRADPDGLAPPSSICSSSLRRRNGEVKLCPSNRLRFRICAQQYDLGCIVSISSPIPIHELQRSTPRCQLA